VRQLLYQFARLPWSYIILFNVAALSAFVLAMMLVFGAVGGHATSPDRTADSSKRIAISFDDAPRGGGAFLEPQIRPQMLRAALKRAGVKQAVFFVNPGRAGDGTAHATELRDYARAGHVLANHTADHIALSDVSPDRFLANIDEAESALKKEKGYRAWFRFPRLDEGGKDTIKRDAIRAGLKARGIRNGYVTADGWDWYLENLAIKAVDSGKRLDHEALRKLYIETHVGAANFADNLARRTLGRAPAHMLLLHETDLAALYLEDLVKALRADGWTIITADVAYADPMGKLPPPVIAHANGTLIQMLSWDRGTKGPRWYERNERDEMTRLFNARVLRQNN
jgi:peptidoglycan-N-acetylglucosamine deacetylase